MAGIPRSLPEVIRRAIEGALIDVHVALPGKVLAYDPKTNLADVAPQVQHSVWDSDNTRTYEEIPTLPGVPVMWPRAGGFLLTLPLAVGDTGLIVFSSDAIGEWRASGQLSKPADASRLDVGWPVFLPGLFADVAPPAVGDLAQRTAGLVLGKDAGVQQITMAKIPGTTIDIGKGATDFVALAALVLTELQSIRSQYNTHVHAVAAFGPSAAPTTPMTAPNPVAATIARAK